MPFGVGETVGSYRILEQLGRGGMATVFKAYHPALDRYVAIKALHPAFMEDPNFLARFQREAKVVAKLEHPNIVPIYDFAEYEGRPYLVMKYIEGETLKARLSRGPIARSELLKIAKAVGDGLHYAHRKGILHRDVKPSNVLLGLDKRIYLADFGLARIAQAGESTLSSDMVLGTPQYISPEQAMGMRELDEGTDIYSLGVMFYEMVVGRVPFSADTPFSVIHDHIYTPLPLPRQVNLAVSEAVERVLLKALAKERKDRYQDVISLIESFLDAIETSPIPVESEQEETAIHPGTAMRPEEAAVIGASELEPDIDAHLRATRVSQKEDEESLLPEPQEGDAEIWPEAGDVDVEEEQTQTSTGAGEEEPASGRRLKWWQVGGTVIVLVLVLMVGWKALSSLGQEREPPQEPQEISVEEQAGNVDEDDPLGWVLRQVEENPDEPHAHLDLASVYMDLGETGNALESIRQAFLLSEGNEEVLIRGIDLLAQSQNWVMLSNLLLGFLQSHPEAMSKEIYDRFAQAAYLAASEPRAEKNIPISGIAEIHKPLERVIKARYGLIHDNPEIAQAILDEGQAERQPGMPEALLLQVEILHRFGDRANAREITTELESRDDVPDWIRSHLGFIWSSLEQDADADERNAIANENDPWTHVEMLEVKLSNGDYGGAEAEVRMILEIGGEDPRLYFSSGDVLSKHGVWPYATLCYLRSMAFGEQASDKVIDRIHMTAYYSGLMENGLEILSNPEVGLGEDLLIILDARHELYFGDVDLAVSKIQIMLDKEPFLIQEQLLQAEKHIAFKEFGAATNLLNRIYEDESNPFWVREEARKMLAELNQ